MRSNPQLHRLYRRLNRKWFSNKLPHDTIVAWEPRLNRIPIQAQLVDEDEPLVILHNPHLRHLTNLVEFNMLHEMAHIATLNKESDDHGPRFQREMMRLARAGAFERIW